MYRVLQPIAIALALGWALLAHAAEQPAASRAAASPTPSGKPARLISFDTCTRVLEGDLIEGAQLGQIRLIGVIAPAQGEPGWRESVEFTRRLAVGKQIKVEICSERPNDYRNRVRAVVYLPDSTNLNTKLLLAGMARLLDHRPCHVDVSAWARYEAEARNAHRGVWAQTSTGAPRAGAQGQRDAAALKRRPTRARVRIRPQP